MLQLNQRHSQTMAYIIASLLLALLSTLSMGCAANSSSTRDADQDSSFRSRGVRKETTIFSPLDLPTPTAIRNGAGAPGAQYWQQQADYKINVQLDTDSDRFTGQQSIVYTNNSPDDLDYVWIHLEQNIFRDDSIGSLTSSNASIAMNDSTTDGHVIHSMQSNGEDVAFTVFDTLARIDLDAPVKANGGTFTLDLEWHFDMPRKAFRRFGRQEVKQGTIYEVAQWFPAMAVYDDVHGWNTMPYAGSGEFYTNFGQYTVNITVPATHIVAATGVLQNPQDVYTSTQLERISEARQSDETVVIRTADEVTDPDSRPDSTDGTLTWTFQADDVRTFAWASSDAFIYDGCNLDGVFVQSVYPEEATPNWEASSQMLRTSIKGYNGKWFKYPYPEATNVNGPEGGMEYPMLIFCGARKSEAGLYGVTTHEIGHNWFPMIVNTDERRHAWMDEGFNTFINYYSKSDWFPGEKGGRGNADSYASNMIKPNRVPIATFPDQLPRGALGRTQYAKPAVGLVLLREQVLGPERFDAAFREYIRRWAFKSPRPADFFRTMEDVAGADLAWFWRGWFLETAYLDQAINDVILKEREDDEAGYVATVSIDNLAEFVMPITLTITYADGSTEKRKYPVEIWYPSNKFDATWPTLQLITSVTIDQDKGLPDVDRSNNTWTAD